MATAISLAEPCERDRLTEQLTDIELGVISGGRVCRQTPPRMEASVQFGSETLVIWATAGGCYGTYWK